MKRKATHRLALAIPFAAACVFVAGSNTAAAAERLPRGAPAAAMLLVRYDANHDGVVTKDEVEAGLKADFAAADMNHDNCLDPGEVSLENEERLRRDGTQASPLRDWNLNGCVDLREFGNTAHSYFDLADRSRDGRVTQLELRGPSMPIAPPGSDRPAPQRAATPQRPPSATGY